MRFLRCGTSKPASLIQPIHPAQVISASPPCHPPPFRLSATAVGFKTSELAEFRLQVAETKTINVNLEVGAQATVVSVTGDAPLVEASEGRVSAVIEAQKLADLPLVGRNFYSLVVLTPGVTGLPTGGTNAYSQNTVDVFITEFGVNMNAGGTRAEQNRFSLDSGSVSSMVRGGVVNVTPNAESVQELRVAVNNFSAEFGAGAGAGVTAISKSGSNALHGAASWFHTNNQLQARNVFSTSVPVFRRNEWVGALGGPIVKNRTFFFGSVDVLRSGVANNSLVQTITPEFLDIVQRSTAQRHRHEAAEGLSRRCHRRSQFPHCRRYPRPELRDPGHTVHEHHDSDRPRSL